MEFLKSGKLTRIMLLGGLIFSLLSGSAQAVEYVFTDLHPQGWHWSRVFAINESGMVAGYGKVTETGGLHAYVWADGNVMDIHPVGWTDSWAYGITETGEVAGIGSPSSGLMHTIFSEHFVVSDLHPESGHQWTRCRGMNDNGQIVGFGLSGNAAVQFGLVWNVNADTITQVVPFGSKQTILYNINNAGLAVGFALIPETGNRTHAFTWQDGTATDIHPEDWEQSFARGVNNSGQVVGEAQITAGNLSHWAVTWDAAGNANVLHVSQYKATRARGINDSASMIVGEGENFATGELHALLWDSDRNVIDLHPEGWINSQSYAVNDAGEILCWGTNELGKIRAFMITVVQ